MQNFYKIQMSVTCQSNYSTSHYLGLYEHSIWSPLILSTPVLVTVGHNVATILQIREFLNYFTNWRCHLLKIFSFDERAKFGVYVATCCFACRPQSQSWGFEINSYIAVQLLFYGKIYMTS